MSDNFACTNQLSMMEQLHMENSNQIEMNSNNVHNRSQEMQSHALETNSGPGDTTNRYFSPESTQSTSTPTINTNSNELQITNLDFCRWCMELLQNRIDHFGLQLNQGVISAEHKKIMEDCVENPQMLLSNEVFDTFLSFLRSNRQKSDSMSQDSAMALESSEILIGNVSGPIDDNKDHTKAQMHDLMQSDTLEPHIPKDNLACASSLNLTKILLEPLKVIQGKILFDLKFINQPKQHWHPRTINCLAKKDCPPLQSAKERKYIVLELPNLKNYDKTNLFAHVQLLTHDGKIHPSKFIVPPKTIVHDPENEILFINDSYGCNLWGKTILYPLKNIRCNECQITLQVYMYNSYKTPGKNRRSSRAQSSTGNNDVNINNWQEFVEDELHKICKLRIQICQLTKDKGFEYVSRYIDTNLIKESKGVEELETIELSQIFPSSPCECGDEGMCITLNANSEKAGFVVTINGKKLAPHEFIGVNRNTMIIYPPRKTAEANGFDLTIEKRNVLKTVMDGHNPHDRLFHDPILNEKIQYASHDDTHQHHHPPNKKQKKK